MKREEEVQRPRQERARNGGLKLVWVHHGEAGGYRVVRKAGAFPCRVHWAVAQEVWKA